MFKVEQHEYGDEGQEWNRRQVADNDWTSRRRRQALYRTAHQDHDSDPGPARRTCEQGQLLDYGRHPRAPRGRDIASASGGSRDHLPQWRGYEFILVHDQILVVDPATLEIVAILEA